MCDVGVVPLNVIRFRCPDWSSCSSHTGAVAVDRVHSVMTEYGWPATSYLLLEGAT